jgi:hypothetical protein
MALGMMSLPKSRGASVVEYALLLFLFIGGAAAAVKSTGFAVRDVFALGAAGELGAEVGQAEMASPPDRDDESGRARRR